MDPKKRSELRLVTNRALGVEVTTQYLDPRYTLVVLDEPKATKTGDLRLVRIDPQSEHADLPSFSARWDHNLNTVDFDLVRAERFETNFRGHHTVVSSPGIYDCDIYVREGHIFTGAIKLGTELALRLADSL